MITKSIAQATIVGEVLWDIFPDHRILGGAPLNVAWNLSGFGAQPVMVSAVGDDSLGHEILSRMQAWKMLTQNVAVLPDRPTGTVQVTLDDGEPSYDITANVAWDAIPEPTPQSVNTEYLYHGSLVWRSTTSRQTVLKLRKIPHVKVFVDVNIRLPHFDRTWVEPILGGAHCVKLNVDELRRITGKQITNPVSRECVARELLEKYGIEQLYVTLGAAGAQWISANGESYTVDAPTPRKWVDAVGAGDAFASVVLYGQLRGLDPRQTLGHAVAYAAEVCGLSGATTSDAEFYKQPFLI